MEKRLFVRNLATTIDSSDLEDLFMTVGDVKNARVVVDLQTGVSRCIGYVEMSTEQEAADCIARFHGQEHGGRILTVTEDVPHVPLPKKEKKSGRASKSV